MTRNDFLLRCHSEIVVRRVLAVQVQRCKDTSGARKALLRDPCNRSFESQSTARGSATSEFDSAYSKYWNLAKISTSLPQSNT